MNIYRLKDVNLKEHINEIIGVECVITEVGCRATKKNDPYLFIHTMDMDKKLKVTLFDNVTYETAANFKRSSVMLLFVQVSTYEKGEDGISCVLKSYENSQTPLAQFIKWEDGFERARDTILEYCDKVKHTCIGKLTVCVLQRFWKQFYNIPAAKSFHHVYLGGLMVHTCCVVELSKRFAEFYNEWYKDDVVNVNLVLCGALLHDIGKLNEFDFSDGISVEYSNDSLLLIHITSGACADDRRGNEDGDSRQARGKRADTLNSLSSWAIRVGFTSGASLHRGRYSKFCRSDRRKCEQACLSE